MKIIFWNIYKKELSSIIADMIYQYEADIVVLAESENLSSNKLVNQMHSKAQEWNEIVIKAKGNIKVFAKKQFNILPHKEEKHFSSYKIYIGDKILLMNTVHFPSAMYSDEVARGHFAERISQQFEKIEETIYDKKERSSFVVGDFNLQPYSYGIAGVNAFNATMSMEKAKTISRKVNGEQCLFYYNPIWQLIGKKGNAQGSYYSENDQQSKSMYWYSFDEVLLRPSLIDRFEWTYFDYITEINKMSLLINGKIDKKKYSDHLPLKFEIMEE